MGAREQSKTWHSDHQIEVAAAPQDVWRAVHDVTLAELRLTRLLLTARGLPGRLVGQPQHLAGAEQARTLLDAFVAGGFAILDEAPPKYLLGGGIGQPWRPFGGHSIQLNHLDWTAFDRFDEPGFVKVTLAFELRPAGESTQLATRTTVTATDARAARSFAPYWFVIKAGSDRIRRELLHAITTRSTSYRSKTPGHSDRATGPCLVATITADPGTCNQRTEPPLGGPLLPQPRRTIAAAFDPRR
jgi:hypothetical protein